MGDREGSWIVSNTYGQSGNSLWFLPRYDLPAKSLHSSGWHTDLGKLLACTWAYFVLLAQVLISTQKLKVGFCLQQMWLRSEFHVVHQCRYHGMFRRQICSWAKSLSRFWCQSWVSEFPLTGNCPRLWRWLMEMVIPFVLVTSHWKLILRWVLLCAFPLVNWLALMTPLVTYWLVILQVQLALAYDGSENLVSALTWLTSSDLGDALPDLVGGFASAYHVGPPAAALLLQQSGAAPEA